MESMPMIPQFVRMPMWLIEKLRLKKQKHGFPSMAETAREYILLGLRTEELKDKFEEKPTTMTNLLEIKDRETLVDKIINDFTPEQISALDQACKLAKSRL